MGEASYEARKRPLESDLPEQIEVRVRRKRRRRWTAADKLRIVEEAFAPGAVAKRVAERHEIIVRDAATLQKTKQRRATSGYPMLAHRRNDLVQRPVVLLLHQGENFIGVIVQRRTASPAEFGLKSPRLPPRLMPPHS